MGVPGSQAQKWATRHSNLVDPFRHYLCSAERSQHTTETKTDVM